ncbi:MAG: HD domain-containing phosphohydrolase [Polyangiales bacterium]
MNTLDKTRPQLLCVDDEANVLEGLSMHLRRGHEVLTATSGRDGLEILREKPSIAVVISDMRMPNMDGATFLARARQLSPNSVRILLTGQTELDAAISAVNEGQIFRFLTKPCPPQTLLRAVEAALEQHRLLNAERVLLEQTLHGSIKALTDVLALVDPVSFGRASRIKRLVTELCSAIGVDERWPVEVAAMLSQLGNITLPAETVEKLARGGTLDASEQQMVSRLPQVTEKLLGNIPRLEPVRELLVALFRSGGSSLDGASRRAASILRLAVDYDTLEASGLHAQQIMTELRARSMRYDANVFEALARLRDRPSAPPSGRTVPIAGLQVGMVFAEDVRSKTGILLAARGFEVTEGFIERVRNLRSGSVGDSVSIL